MNPRFEFDYDGHFLMSATKRYYSQRYKLIPGLLVKITASIILILLAVLMAFQNKFGWAVFFVALVFLLSFARCVDYWIMKRGLKKSPWNGSHMNITLSPDGLHIISDKSDVFLKWGAFTKAVRFNDGFMLFQGPKVFNWLPQSALIEGYMDDIDSLLKENIKNYKY